jgi:hypothetical protein
MKIGRALFLIGLLLMVCTASYAQTISNIYGMGASYNQSGTPSIAGTGLYAHLVSPSLGTYAFTVLDILPNNQKTFTVSTNIGVGVAQKLFSIKTVPVFVPASVGISTTGTNTGWAWTAGGMVVIPVKGNWYALPSIRLVKANSGYQPIIGVLMAWGH